MPSPSPEFPGRDPHTRGTASGSPLAGQVVVFSGKLSSLGRREARALVERLGGAAAEDVTVRTTMLVIGAEGSSVVAPAGGTGAGDAVAAAPEGDTEAIEQEAPATPSPRSQKLKRAEELNADRDRIRILDEDAFCQIAGVPSPAALRRQYHSTRDLLARYPQLREYHLRYLVKCGVIQPAARTHTEAFFPFSDLAAIKQVNDEMAGGAPFHAVARSLVAARHGQLAFDFRLDAAPAKILALRRPSPSPTPQPVEAGPGPDRALAEEYFRIASALDDGDEAKLGEAAAAYRKALEVDPYLVAALINLANVHYSRDELVEAQALYERAIGLEPDFFEAHFNLGNIYHDLGRFAEAQACYRETLRLNPFYADAHFYLAVTFEKMGLSQDAKPHWKSYRQLAPNGEWVELAKEFSE